MGDRSIVDKGLAYCRFASTQVFTGAVPFNDSRSTAASLAIIQGGRPLRPTHPAFTEELWKLMQRCWDHTPSSRPEIPEVLQIVLATSVSRSF